MNISKKPKKDFSIISNRIIRDKRSSLRARGLLLTMISLPNNWEFSVEGLCAIMSDGRANVRGAIHELEELGYLKRSIKHDANGKFDGYIYAFNDAPSDGITSDGITSDGITSDGITSDGITSDVKSPQYNIEKSNTIKSRTKELKTYNQNGENEFSPTGDDEVIEAEVVDEPQALVPAEEEFQLTQEVVQRKRYKYSPEFEEFWKAYPPVHKQQKPLAYDEWKKALKRASIPQIMRGLENVKRGDVSKLPRPAYWLKDNRWEDEPDYSQMLRAQMNSRAYQREMNNQRIINHFEQLEQQGANHANQPSASF